MKITIRAIGKDNSKEYKKLCDEYIKRLPWKINIEEVANVKSGSITEVQRKEARNLLTKINKSDYIIALDEKGKKFSSESFSKSLFTQIESGIRHIIFLVGGANGFDDSIRERANLMISLSDMTFPHMMVRLILIEQLYRAFTISQGHPYHKS